MKIDFQLSKKNVDSVFSLLGNKEDDMTYSFGWSLKSSPTLLTVFLKSLGLPDVILGGSDVLISLQEHKSNTNGFTDIEITVRGENNQSAHIIIEAKRGWTDVTQAQVEKYVFASEEDRDYKIVVLLTNYDDKRIKDFGFEKSDVSGDKITYVSGESLLDMPEAYYSASIGKREKWVLNSLLKYTKEIVGGLDRTTR